MHRSTFVAAPPNLVKNRHKDENRLHPSIQKMSVDTPSTSQPSQPVVEKQTLTKWPFGPMTVPPPPPLSQTLYLRRKRRLSPFFEGWYLRVILPNTNQSYAFMFSVESPGIGTVQLLDADENLHISYLKNGSKFYCYNPFTMAGQWAYANAAAQEPRPLNGIEFEKAVMQGYQLSRNACHGRFGAGDDLVQWGFDYSPYIGWGDRNGKQRATSTWVGWLKLFEPGYQVTMGHGVVKQGYIQIGQNRIDVTDAVVYGEKNWGSAFPSKWWWVQANGFWDQACRDLTVTALGAYRKVLWNTECVGMICVHYQGFMYEFANWTSEDLEWEIEPWGSWKASSKSITGHTVEIEAKTSAKPIPVLGPSKDGMIYNVQDSAYGNLSLRLTSPTGETIVETACTNAQVEVGGGPWEETWKGSVAPLPGILRNLVNYFNGSSVATTPK